MAIGQLNGAITLGANASAAGNWMTWIGGKGIFSAEGTFNLGSVALEFMSLNGTAIPVTDTWGSLTKLSAQGDMHFELPPGQIRMNVSGSPSAMYVYAIGEVQ